MFGLKTLADFQPLRRLIDNTNVSDMGSRNSLLPKEIHGYLYVETKVTDVGRQDYAGLPLPNVLTLG